MGERDSDQRLHSPGNPKNKNTSLCRQITGKCSARQEQLLHVEGDLIAQLEFLYITLKKIVFQGKDF